MKKILKMGWVMYAVMAIGIVVWAEIDTADHTYSGKLDFTTASDVRILGGAKLTATSTELNIMDGVMATATEINTAVDASQVTAGTASNAAAVVTTDTLAQVKKTVISITNCVLTATDTSEEGESKIFFGFPAVDTIILGANANLQVVNSAAMTGNFSVGIGTAAASDAADLTSTECNIIASATLAGGTAVTTNAFDGVLAVPLSIDGSTTPVSLYINAGVADASMTGNPTMTFTGTLTIYWINGTSNQ